MTRRPLARELAWVIRSGWQVMAAVLPGVALVAAHGTMFDVPNSDLIQALDSDRYRIHWISGSYLVGSAAGLALSRFVGSRLGLRLGYLLGAVLFALGALGCGLVSEVVWMTPLRVTEGIGCGLLLSIGMVLVWRTFPHEREFAMAIYGMAVFVPAVMGITIGGLLTHAFSWRMVFFVSSAAGLLVAAVAAALLPVDRQRRPVVPVHLDLIGFGLLLVWLASMNAALDYGQYWGWLTSRHLVAWGTLSAAAFLAFVAWGTLARAPLISMRIFDRRNATLGLAIKALFSVNLYTLFALLTQYFVNVRGYQWWQGALIVLAAPVAMACSILMGIAVGGSGNRRVRMFVGLTTMVAVTWWLGFVDLFTSKFVVSGVLGIWGLGAGLVIGPALITIFEGVSAERALTMAGVFNILRAQPAYVATVVLTTLWVQTTDNNFDNMRQRVDHNVPIAAASFKQAERYFQAKGSSPLHSQDQAHALIRQWTHSNARVFALQTVMRELAMVTAVGLPLVLLVRRRKAAPAAVYRPIERAAA